MHRPALAIAFAALLLALAPPVVAQETTVEETGQESTAAATGRVFYVRQTVGADFNDGLSPERAFQSISMLSDAVRAGDVAYVGPGLYRDQIIVRGDGTAEYPIRFVADPQGQWTGDPPGPVVITGADVADERLFEPHDAPGVFKANYAGRPVAGAVEMDGSQARYKGVLEPLEETPPLERVARQPGSFYFDRETEVLYVHTSDGEHPTTHELELIRRTGGVSMTDRHFVSVEGFTFRHVLDAGVIIAGDSSDVTASGNISFGNRQGIRVNGASRVTVTDNVLFRNDNSGVYFLRQATDGTAARNVAYENAKGLRWSSQSHPALVEDNVAFDNSEAGIAIESVEGVRLTGNVLANNGQAQLLAIRSDYASDDNCYAPGHPSQLVADLFFNDKFPTLELYRKATGRDLGSRQGDCGSLPAKLDVHQLHAETLAYADRARGILEQAAAASGAGD